MSTFAKPNLVWRFNLGWGSIEIWLSIGSAGVAGVLSGASVVLGCGV